MVDKKVLRSLLLYLFPVYLAVLRIKQCTAETCVQTGLCSCAFDGWTFNLQPLAETVAKDKPVFSYHKDSDTYDYKPCIPFQAAEKINGTCAESNDVALSLSAKGRCQILGEQKTAKFQGNTDDEEGMYIQYEYKHNHTIISKVHMLCNKIQEFRLNDLKIPPGTTIYNFHLFTPYACRPIHHTLSAGSILLILFLLVFIIYLLAGFAFKHFYLGAQGVEIIPHYTFWSDFPLLVRDGCFYTFRCCRGPSNYERI